MAHAKHTHVPGGIYLVSSIGERGREVFVDDDDRAALGELVAQVIVRCGARIHAFAWLDREISMVAQVYEVSLSGVMQRIASVHARRVNAKLGHRGYVFQHPHRAILLEDSVSILEAVATLHRSPAKWSSHLAYLDLEDIPWLTRGVILALLSDTPEALPIAFPAFVRLAKSTQANTHRPYDEFLAWLKNRAAKHTKAASLDQLIYAVARWARVEPAAIQSGASTPVLSLARALIAWAAMQNGIASLADLAKRFNRGRSTVYETREMYRARAPHLFDLRLGEILAGPMLPVSDVLRLIGATPESAPSHHK